MPKFLTLILLLSVYTFSVTLAPEVTQAMPQVSAPSGGQTMSGKVIETMDAAGYTYLRIETGGKESWVAIPETKVESGTTVNYYAGMEMHDFTSKSLNRTFASITFSSGLVDAPQAAATPAAATPAATDDSFAAAVAGEKANKQQPAAIAEVSGGSTGAIVPYNEIEIEKSTAANGFNVEEIFAKAKELNGQTIQVRGKVVKFSPMIMGKNWIHIQDGSGDPMQNSHDLVITTTETVEVDTVATFEGVLAANKDFGAGYKYPAIIEEATTIK